MEALTVQVTIPQIQDALNKAAEEVFKSSYNNPMKNALEEVFKQKKQQIEEMVSQIVADCLTNPEFKAKLSDLVLQRMVHTALAK